MKLARKFVGIVVAGGLTLSLLAGASAQQTGTGTATMEEGVCQFTSMVVADGDFGTWKYDGTSYVYAGPFDNSSRTIRFATKMLFSKPEGTCKVTVDTDGLEQDGTVVVGKENMGVRSLNMGSPYSSYWGFGTAGRIFPVHQTANGGSQTFQVILDETLDDQVAPDSYTATFTLSIENGD